MKIFHPLLRGAIELHCHSYPSVFPRRQTDWELVVDIKAAGMAGVVLKSHEASTTDRATLIRLKEPKLHVYGGLACNYFTGGLSPSAVDVAIRSGAKIIWMPTISAQAHQDDFAKRPTKLFGGQPLVQPSLGLRIWDNNKQILPEVHQILDLIAKADIALATGHLSPGEVDALVDAALERGIKPHKILIQHVDVGIVPIPLAQQQSLTAKGVLLEKCYLACTEDFGDLSVSLDQMAASIKHLGAQSCVMVTDYGQEHNVGPVEGLSTFISEMLSRGVSEDNIRQMIVTNPHQLLGLKNIKKALVSQGL